MNSKAWGQPAFGHASSRLQLPIGWTWCALNEHITKTGRTPSNVVDFLQFHWAGWFFPAFNVADSAITVGAIMLILDGLFLQRRIKAVK